MTINQIIDYAKKHNVSFDDEIEIFGYPCDQIVQACMKPDRITGQVKMNLISKRQLCNKLFSGINNVEDF